MADLKRLSAILFLSVYLLTATEFSQVLKLNVLWEHFQEHKVMNSGVTLLDFFREHYFNGDRQDLDYTRDMQLPFKTHNPTPISLITIYSSALDPDIKSPEYPILNFTEVYERPRLSSDFCAAIWQPPKA